MNTSLSKLTLGGLVLGVLFLSSSLAYSPDALGLSAGTKHTPIGSGYVHNQLIVKLKSDRTLADVDAFNRINGVLHSEKIVEGRASSPGLGRLYLLEFASDVDVGNFVARYESNPSVEYAEPNFIYSLDAFPNDPEFSRLWGLQNTGQFGGTSGSDIDAPQAWNVATDSSQVVVGVIDTGVNYNHPDLAANMWKNPGEIPNNGVDDDANGFVDDYYGYDFSTCLGLNPPGTRCTTPKPRDGDPMDDVGHGTHVAGTIGAVGNNSLGVTGVAWKAKIMAIKALTPIGGLTSDLIDAINYATTMNVKLTSNSWGGGGFSQAVFDAIKAARDSDALFVAAAGNGGSDGIGDNNDVTPHYPSSYDLNNIIAVAATDINDHLTDFSNFGATSVDLAAPGDLILSTWYKVDPSFADVTFSSTTIEGIPLEFSPTTSTSGITATAQNAGLGNPSDFTGQNFNGKIAVMQRGSITFGEKVTNAMNAGAIGAIIYNNVDGMFTGTLGSASNWIPTASISKSDGIFLVAQLPRTVTLKITASNYVYLSGTSMSTPHVSGAAALLRQRFPAANYTSVKNMILSSTDPLPSLTGKTVTGGRLNLFKALTLIDFHDVAVPNMKVSRNFAYAGIVATPIQVNATVSNIGSRTETITVKAFANATVIGTQNITVAVGAVAVVSFSWNVQFFTRGIYRLSSQVLQVIGETNLSNNQFAMSGFFEVRKAGDVNGDGSVDINDLIVVYLNQFTTNIPSYYDIDNDGDVDLDDFVLVYLHQFT